MNAPESADAPPVARRGVESVQAHGHGLHAQHASADVLLQRLEDVQRVGNGWRARCPACGGRSRKMSIAEAGDRVLVHCFACNDANAILAAVGLTWADLHPPRSWPESPWERREAMRAMRQAGWAAALGVLGREATVIAIAASDILAERGMDWDDYARLVLASERIDAARQVLT